MGKRVKIDTFHYPLPLGTILLIYEQNLKSLRLEFSAHIPAEIKEFSWEWISLFLHRVQICGKGLYNSRHCLYAILAIQRGNSHKKFIKI